MRGYFAIGIYNGKTGINLGTLWRSAYQLGANYIFTIGRRYKHQKSDTTKSWRHIPLFNYLSWTQFFDSIPYNCKIVAIEMGGKDIRNFVHPERCIYLLGAEDNGLPPKIIKECNYHLSVPAIREECYNVAMAGTIVLFDRFKQSNQSPSQS